MKNLLSFLFCTLTATYVFAQVPRDSTTILLQYQQAQPGDRFILYRSGDQKPAFVDEIVDADTIRSVSLPGNQFLLKLPTQKVFLKNLAYIHLRLLRKRPDQLNLAQKSDAVDDYEVLPLMLSCVGDDISIDLNEKQKILPGHSYMHNFTMKIKGLGSAKYIVHQKVDSIWYNMPFGKSISKERNYIDTNYIFQNIQKSLKLLSENRNKLNPQVFAMLQTYAVYCNLSQEAVLINHFYKKDFINWSKEQKTALIRKLDAKFSPQSNYLQEFSLTWSKEYIDALIAKANLVTSITSANPKPDSVYFYLKYNLSSDLRDKAITQYLLHDGLRLDNPDHVLNDALNVVKNPSFKPYIINLHARTSGELAYNFSLPNKEGKLVHLSDFKGKIVLIDFWFTGCSSCKDFYDTELSKVEKYYEEDPDVVFITISIDKAKSTWLKSISSGEYTSSKATNLYTSGLGMESDATKYYRVGSFPQPMLIGKDFRIHGFGTFLRSEKGIKEAINNLK